MLIEFLHECFILREDGALIWRQRPREHFTTDHAHAAWNGRFPGTEAGSLNRNRMRVKVKGRHLRIHRIVYAMTQGVWPAREIDHRDGNGANNRASNLREAPDRSSQMQNRKRNVNNTSGYIGVYWCRRAWVAQIGSGGKRLHLGYFDTPEEAYAAYLAAKKIHHPFQPEPRP